MPSKGSDSLQAVGEETPLLLPGPLTPPNVDLEGRSVDDTQAFTPKSPAAIISVLLIGTLNCDTQPQAHGFKRI